MKTPHKHAELIIAWANGAEIEVQYEGCEWFLVDYPEWCEDAYYRIKPEPKPTRHCRSCGGTGERHTGVDESPTTICKPCDGTGQIAIAEQPEQEPVGEVQRHGLDSHGRQWHGIHWYNSNVDVPHRTKLYTSPPAREWAGLTDDERRVCTQSPFTEENYRAIEAKLKEKNHEI
jgi:hypothetical protein